LYSLLHVDPGTAHKNANLERSEISDVDVYICCGLLLARSCRWYGVPYAILTNEPEFVNQRLQAIKGEVEVVACQLDRQVPKGIPFFSAHFKLDVLKEMGTGSLGDFVGLVDLDMVMLRPFDLGPVTAGATSLYIYDLTLHQIAAYGEGALRQTLTTLGCSSTEAPRWYGGEFIVGYAEGFRRLSEEIDALYDRYLASHEGLHHIGDEAVVTAALINASAFRGLSLTNAAPAAVSRWWSARTRSPQAPFSQINSASLLHLPADKVFLAREADEPFDPTRFLSRYKSYLRRKIILRRLTNPLLNILQGQQGQEKHRPRL
jgi:hypothetical protein